MKKIFLFVVAAFAMLFTSCQNCGNTPEPEQKDDAVVITSDDWKDIIAKVIPAVNANYPEYAFYEASGTVKKLDDQWGIDHNTFQAAFGNPFRVASVLAYVQNDTLKFYQVDEPWCEDVYTTPFTPCDLDLAIKTLQKTIDIAPEGSPAVLRFQLYPGIIEPQVIVGTIAECHTVNVYSLTVDQPLGDTKNLVVEHTGLAAKK